MNRNEEYFSLLEQLEEESPAVLDDCAERARKKARARRGWRVSLASLGGMAAAFVLLVNLSLPFALACARIPGLRELVANLAFAPSLKAAVQNDFLQYIGQSQTQDGLNMSLDSRFTAPGKTYDLNEWVTVDSQRLLIKSLEVNPTHARLAVTFDGNNTAWCDGLDFYLTDARGNRYESGSHVGSNSSLVATGTGEEGQVVYYLESPHFTGKGPYTLHITGADWLDKGKEWVTVDLEKGAARGLPAGTELVELRREGKNMRLSFSTPYRNKQLFSWTFRDEEGAEFHVSSGSYYKRENEDGSITEVEEFRLPDYAGSILEIKLNYTRIVELEEEVLVEIRDK